MSTRNRTGPAPISARIRRVTQVLAIRQRIKYNITVTINSPHAQISQEYHIIRCMLIRRGKREMLPLSALFVCSERGVLKEGKIVSSLVSS